MEAGRRLLSSSPPPLHPPRKRPTSHLSLSAASPSSSGTMWYTYIHTYEYMYIFHVHCVNASLLPKLSFFFFAHLSNAYGLSAARKEMGLVRLSFLLSGFWWKKRWSMVFTLKCQMKEGNGHVGELGFLGTVSSLNPIWIFCRFLYGLAFGSVEKHFAHCSDYTEMKRHCLFFCSHLNRGWRLLHLMKNLGS